MADDKLQFRAMTAEDITAGLALCRLARWNQTERDWELFLTLSPSRCRVAVKGERVVGTVTTVNYENIFSWIGMVLVDPAQRRQGIGTRLLHEALGLLRDQPLIGLDATPVGREVYVNLGFRDECQLSRMEMVVADSFGRAENNSSRRMTDADWPQVLDLDKQIFGADRSLILKWMRDGAPDLARVVDRHDCVVGFSFGRRGFNFDHIGPVIAEDAQTAIQLASACLAERRGKSCVIDAAHHNAEWLNWLGVVGFKQQRPFIRMFRGEARRPGVPEKQFAILGPEFG